MQRNHSVLFQKPEASYLKTSLDHISGLIVSALPPHKRLSSLEYVPSSKKYSDGIKVKLISSSDTSSYFFTKLILRSADFPDFESLSNALYFHLVMTNLRFNYRSLGISDHNYVTRTVTLYYGNIQISNLERFYDIRTHVFDVDAFKAIVNSKLLEAYDQKLQSRCIGKAPKFKCFEPGFQPGTMIQPHFTVKLAAENKH